MSSPNAAAVSAVSPPCDLSASNPVARSELLAAALAGYAGAQPLPEIHQAVHRLRYLLDDYNKERDRRAALYSYHERMDRLDSAVAWLERLVGVK